jgi:hypothetical protein
VQSLAGKWVAILIAFLFLSATAQCTALCTQADNPEKQDMPCHQHAAACTKGPLTAEHVAHSAIPAPAAMLLPADFMPIVRFVDYQYVLLPRPAGSLKTSVLLI